MEEHAAEKAKLEEAVAEKQRIISVLEHDVARLRAVDERSLELEAQIREKEQVVEKLTEEVEGLKNGNGRVQELEAEVSKKQGVLDAMKEEVEKLKEFEAVVTAKEEELSMVKKEISRLAPLEDRIRELESSLTEQTESHSSLQSELEQLKSASTRLTEVETALLQRTESLTALETEVESLRTQSTRLPQLEAALSERTESLTSLQTELESLRSTSTRLPEVEAALAERSQSLAALETELQRFKAAEERGAELERALGEKSQSLLELQGEVEIVRAAKDELEDARAKIAGLEEAVKEKQNEIEGLKEELETTKKELISAQERIEELETNHKDLQTTHDQHIADHTTQLDTLRSEHQKALTDLQSNHDHTLTTLRNDHTDQVQSLRSEIDSIVQTHNNDLTTLTTTHAEELASIKITYEALLSAHKEELLALEKAHTQALESHKASTTLTIHELRSEIDTLKMALQESESSFQQLQSRHNDLRGRYEATEGQLKDMVEAFEAIDGGEEVNARKVKEMREEAERELEAMRTEFESRVGELEEEKKELEAELERRESEMTSRGVSGEESDPSDKEGDRGVGDAERMEYMQTIESLREELEVLKAGSLRDMDEGQEQERDSAEDEGDSVGGVDQQPFIPDYRTVDAIAGDVPARDGIIPEVQNAAPPERHPPPSTDEMTNIMAQEYANEPQAPNAIEPAPPTEPIDEADSPKEEFHTPPSTLPRKLDFSPRSIPHLSSLPRTLSKTGSGLWTKFKSLGKGNKVSASLSELPTTSAAATAYPRRPLSLEASRSMGRIGKGTGQRSVSSGSLMRGKPLPKPPSEAGVAEEGMVEKAFETMAEAVRQEVQTAVAAPNAVSSKTQFADMVGEAIGRKVEEVIGGHVHAGLAKQISNVIVHGVEEIVENGGIKKGSLAKEVGEVIAHTVQEVVEGQGSGSNWVANKIGETLLHKVMDSKQEGKEHSTKVQPSRLGLDIPLTAMASPSQLTKPSRSATVTAPQATKEEVTRILRNELDSKMSALREAQQKLLEHEKTIANSAKAQEDMARRIGELEKSLSQREFQAKGEEGIRRRQKTRKSSSSPARKTASEISGTLPVPSFEPNARNRRVSGSVAPAADAAEIKWYQQEIKNRDEFVSHLAASMNDVEEGFRRTVTDLEAMVAERDGIIKDLVGTLRGYGVNSVAGRGGSWVGV